MSLDPNPPTHLHIQALQPAEEHTLELVLEQVGLDKHSYLEADTVKEDILLLLLLVVLEVDIQVVALQEESQEVESLEDHRKEEGAIHEALEADQQVEMSEEDHQWVEEAEEDDLLQLQLLH